MSSAPTAALAAAIRGVPDVWREVEGDGEAGFLEAAGEHRVRPLVAWVLRTRGEFERWPAAVREKLHAAERAEAAVEVARRVEIARVASLFGDAGIDVLVLKGAAFAYSLYPEPWLRPRQDTDLLVSPARVDAADRVLTSAGYHPDPAVGGAFVSQQRNYVRREHSGLRHDCDLHWKPANPVAIADLFPFDALWSRSVALPVGGVLARTVGPVDALLLASLHRASHHADSGDLIWLYDLHLLAERFTEVEWAAFVERAGGMGAGAICARGLRLCGESFGTRIETRRLEALEQHGGGDALSVFLRSDASKADLLKADLAAVRGWRGRARLLREHLFPPADYMLRSTGHSSRLLLPALYARRILRGARGWFEPR